MGQQTAISSRIDAPAHLRKKVSKMGKGIRVTVLALITGVFFIGGAWSQEKPPSDVFSGTVTQVDLANQRIVVQNNDGEMTFQWNNETQVQGSPVEKGGLNSKNLKEGMFVTILYKEGDQNRVAHRIDGKPSNLKTLKGLSFPFECGLKVC
jgi:hypothetical protein